MPFCLLKVFNHYAVNVYFGIGLTMKLTDDEIETAIKPFVDLRYELEIAFKGKKNIPEEITDIVDRIWSAYCCALTNGDHTKIS